ncbi:alpha/beta fold hydrolase [Ktedonosporobacter rubrisoli]|uniref:Alpha/beta fold hydrolase n=1 Tax=Ktedonosporobacter rubrisoli TaxID=2509675 RepID=A0A4P6JLQ1_KTERU|nr:alpha/beta hydrolase [Ktedonosporobacter rubrisoli]QBD76187.1 alpha/beta fold hydrolase [Ktedonosporobacter rubrisoli]
MTTTAHNQAGKYAAVNGIELYYEIHGTGTPLVMLHGGFGTFDMFAALSPTLAQNHQIIGVDLYGHGRTALTDRQFSIEDMADDIAELIKYLGLEKADLLGYSLGGKVALQTAIRHPERINRLILISTPFKRTGWYPEIQAGMAAMAPEFFAGTPMQEAYMSIAPKPEDFTRFVTAMKETMSRDYDWTEQIPTLKPPTLLVAGDADSFSPIHVAEFFQLLGGGKQDAGWNGEHMIASRLAILPGATHYNIIFRPDLLLPVLSLFLDDKESKH